MSGQHTAGLVRTKGPSLPNADTPEGGDFAILDEQGEILAEVFARVARGDEGLRPAEANARRIVQSWNHVDELVTALQPFANYACDKPCDCHNCRARSVIAKFNGTAA